MGERLPDSGAAVFQTERAIAALEKYAAVTRLTVLVYTRDGRAIVGPIGSNPLFEIFTRGREPAILADCVQRCLSQTDASAIVVEDGHGLAVVGVSFASAGAPVMVAVAGYALPVTSISVRFSVWPATAGSPSTSCGTWRGSGCRYRESDCP